MGSFVAHYDRNAYKTITRMFRMDGYNPHTLELPNCPPNTYLLWRRGSGSTIEICEIEVDSRYRRKKWGQRMVYKLKELVPSDTTMIYAITRIDNIVAQKFYSSQRFRVVASLWNFYQDRPELVNCCDALMFGKDLKAGKDA